MLCGISPIFTGLFPTSRKVIHVLRTRSPRAHNLYCYRLLRVRLACVKHAASVRSEPGSNSRLKSGVSNTSITTRVECLDWERTFKSLGYLKCSPYTGTPGAKTVTKRVLA